MPILKNKSHSRTAVCMYTCDCTLKKDHQDLPQMLTEVICKNGSEICREKKTEVSFSTSFSSQSFRFKKKKIIVNIESF